jgi:CysZ protein
MTDFFRGIHYVGLSLQLLFLADLKPFVIVPIIINALIFTILFFIANHYMFALNHWLVSFLPFWLQWLSVIFWLLFFVSFLIVIAYTFTLIANLIAAPFNSLLADKVALYLQGKPLTDEGNNGSVLSTILPSMKRQMAVIIYYLPRALAILLLFFIPLIQIGAFIIWTFFNAWFLSVQYLDYPSDAQGISFGQMLVKMQHKRALLLGFGLSILGLSLIPIINFISMPVAVIAATHIWLNEMD